MSMNINRNTLRQGSFNRTLPELAQKPRESIAEIIRKEQEIYERWSEGKVIHQDFYQSLIRGISEIENK